MLIPSIDLQGGRIVQLVQGEKLAIAATDPEVWISRFSPFPRVQLIDLDAAKGEGDNAAMVAEICKRLPCRVGGGIRSIERATAVPRGRRTRRHREFGALPQRNRSTWNSHVRSQPRSAPNA
jgi:phosphoribosylformimino-5-aminoimidazole carboxamide ribonucleotide (ProFAR) isomerase